MLCSSPTGMSDVLVAGALWCLAECVPASRLETSCRPDFAQWVQTGVSEKCLSHVPQLKAGTASKIIMRLDDKKWLKILQFIRVIFKNEAAVCSWGSDTLYSPCKMSAVLRRRFMVANVLLLGCLTPELTKTAHHIDTLFIQIEQWDADRSTPGKNSGTFGHITTWLCDSDKPLGLAGFRISILHNEMAS